MYLHRIPAIVALSAFLMAGCSANAGFGTPASEPAPLNNGYPQNGEGPNVSPLPSGASPQAMINEPDLPGGGVVPEPVSSGSPTPQPSAPANTLSIIGSSVRLAYNASAADPIKAPRLLELSFALQNTTPHAAKIADVKASADKKLLADRAVSVTAPPNQVSEVAAVVVPLGADTAKLHQLRFDFISDAKKVISSQAFDIPAQDFSFTALDDKHPKGAISVDSVEVSRVDAGGGLYYECTFTMTNASAVQGTISHFTIVPPKGSASRVAIPLIVPARSTSGFMTIVLPYTGKALPQGTFTIMAMQNNATVAKASAILL